MDSPVQPNSPNLHGLLEQPLIYRDELNSILSNLSHELCRPLISLRAGFDLLLETSETPVSPDQRNHLFTMVSLCDDLLRLTRSYLDFASMVQGTRPLSWGTFSLGALFADIESQFAPQAKSLQIEWKILVEQPDLAIITDASRCQQILGNLVSNAPKYTPPGGSVRVRALVEDRYWSTFISDSGSGIPPDAVAKVFEPFYRLKRDENAGIEGNGLGLAICRELVNQLRGEIRLESSIGQGTTVHVCLPRALESRFISGTPDASHSVSSKARTTKGRKSRRPTTAPLPSIDW